LLFGTPPKMNGHGNRVTMIGLAGAAFGYAKYKTGSTAASTLQHSGFNLMGALAYLAQWEHGAL
jgi:membrane protease YdiL (CAAX protease family)